jgi:hypothetical protein
MKKIKGKTIRKKIDSPYLKLLQFRSVASGRKIRAASGPAVPNPHHLACSHV